MEMTIAKLHLIVGGTLLKKFHNIIAANSSNRTIDLKFHVSPYYFYQHPCHARLYCCASLNPHILCYLL